MKAKLLYLLSFLVLSDGTLPAANIAWVTFHSGNDTPSAAASGAGFTNAPDRGYTLLLAANGHTVTRFLTVDSIDTFPAVVADLNTNDLVIIGRSVNSGHYQQANETGTWNTNITKPMMILSGFLTRGGGGGGSRLGLTTGETVPDVNSNPVRLRVNAPVHPIFAGLSLNSTNLMVNTYAQFAVYTNATSGATITQRGISVNNNSLIAGGSVLATVGTTGDAAFGGPVIAEFPPGLTTTHFNDVLAARRLIFLTGGREANTVSGDTAGVFDLHTDGATLFLNAVTYLTTPQLPKCTLALVGASNLVAGDTWSFNAGAIGDLPITYQWHKDGVPLAGATTAGLAFTYLDPTNGGQYQLFLTNANGWATSTLAQLSFVNFAAANITNSMISYWPLDAATGSKTVDLVSSYDMTMVNMVSTNIVVGGGRWSNAFAFDNAKQSLLQRVHAGGDALPIYQHASFTISMWVNGPAQVDHRVWAESSTTNVNPVFDLGTHSAGTDGTVDLFIRNDTGGTSLNHGHSTGVAFDGASWHNIVYVQRDVGGGTLKAQLWVDGVLDPLVITATRPITANNTAIGGWLRASASSWFTGLIDEVAVWNRPLSPAEIGVLQVTPVTNPPVRIQPLAINSFKADRPAVASGGSVPLRWDVSKDATLITLSSVGDVWDPLESTCRHASLSIL